MPSPFITVTMPALSPTMEHGVIGKWHKKVGERVEARDILVEIDTDKATMEYAAFNEGFLGERFVKERDKVFVNQPIAVLTETKGHSLKEYHKPEFQPPAVAVKSVEALTEASPTQNKHHTSVAPTSGRSFSQPPCVPEAPLLKVQFGYPTESGFGYSGSGHLKASPYAKKLAKEKGLDMTTVKGTGPYGRITSNDLKLAQPAAPVAFGSRQGPSEVAGAYEEQELSPMRQVVAKRLQESKSFVPHFYVRQEINAEPFLSIREQLSLTGVKVSINDLIVRASALALREKPEINSGFNTVNNTIVRFKTVDISIAVSVDGGLITPIVRYADFKNLGQISVEIRDLAGRAKLGKLAREEYMGGSFTISNLGMFGIADFQAIINPPQAAILAVSAIREVPVIRHGKVVPGKTMNITLSVDHRVIDGVAAAEFLKLLQKYLESPAILLI